MPVAVLSQCEEVLEGGSCHVVGEGPADGTQLRVIKHGSNCGILEGGKFYIRDYFYGFPPCSA